MVGLNKRLCGSAAEEGANSRARKSNLATGTTFTIRIDRFCGNCVLTRLDAGLNVRKSTRLKETNFLSYLLDYVVELQPA
jgi:hypothetical protein